ncbi:MAG TPA: peptide-N-glycosidase F-related protein [Flavobacteriales bacterium]|nr:peptide-N-glycosidase F-related protein [Flavobacteriales bacterium]
MKKLLFAFVILFAFQFNAKAQYGDTISVQTFTFGSPQNAWFVFPSDTIRFEKILMRYTLKCNPAMSPACGEWDYLTYSYLFEHTGLLDSTQIIQPMYTINGTMPASTPYMNTPSYSFTPTWQYYASHSDTTSLTRDTIGTGSISSSAPFGTSGMISRAQYLWRASEMTGAGMLAGDITGLRFYLQSLGATMRNLTIKIKATTADTLTQEILDNAGFTTVYLKNTTFLSTGWNPISLTNAFNWDGISNLIIEITYDNTTTATDNVVSTSATPFTSGLTRSGEDRCADFGSTSYIDLSMNNDLYSIDSAVTVSYWAYGDAAMQPMDGTCFEAFDTLNNRVLNAHMPWSDSNVYWDCGFSGTNYDRINKGATTPEIEAQWNYWTFTKNVATGSMKIYLNGVLWHSGTGLFKPIPKIKKFRLGKGLWAGSQSYEGNMDELAVFNAELDAATIQDYMRKNIDASHPYYSNLVAYYHFDEGNFTTAADVAPGTHPDATYIGAGNPLKNAADLQYNFTETVNRPNIVFEQGVFTTTIDSVLVIDSTMNAPLTVLIYGDSVTNPGVATDTLLVWPAYYNHYLYDAAGNAIDSVYVTPNGTFTADSYDYYNLFPQVIRYELARYITPYGIGLSLGTGWTWTFDVSDYRTLLHDSVHLEAGNWQELLDVEFIMIKGVPPRDILGIQNLWNGGFNYGNPTDPIDNYLTPITVNTPAGAVNSRWKSRVTGHGMDTPENCAEFCPKDHYYKVDGVQQFVKNIWRNNCDRNPLYPQGGTWVYDRANWCPGAEVWTYDLELTPYVTPGTSAVLDHDAEAYSHTGGWDYYQIEDQLVHYGAPNFTNDAALVDVLSPSKNQMWARMNPVCSHPVIKIQNTGSATLTSLTITYGMNGATQSVYNWTGSLAFMETAEVTLGTFAWATGASTFNVTLSAPNGVADQYSFNNSITTPYTYPPVLPADFFVEVKTNNYPWETSYTLKDAYTGTVILDRTSGLTANTNYKDTVSLPDGCYEFELIDSGEDGLSFWANTAQGTGLARLRKTTGSILKSFNADFGGQIYYQFTVGLTNNVDDIVLNSFLELNVYPNPTTGHIYIDANFTEITNGLIEVCDVLGQKVYSHKFNGLTAEAVDVDLSNYHNGTYFVTLRTDKTVVTRKVMKQ